ncbi:hypothetical protein SAMN02745244_02510 [Tessaracoccus bendigoensis DSM 12906]|uniref:Methyltransferase domain-containing protein n=1 Tax=Tessaracoccus bendigoensis DSM 12906 TaxID=1123357 RepID=A0A1M6JBI7_9ACTN|nr:hypothetical protein SAMN02745244_02510 [Tessaracoccus bendigoensis DSM 12906]
MLGCLLEKEVTVPASYPMTLNALRTACNQSSSREPVVDYDERTVLDAVRSLKEKDLARVTWMDYGKRTLKYAQIASEGLGLGDDERALLTVLLLRGPQAAGELKTRSERIFHFADRQEVEARLEAMAQLEVPLVELLPKRAGQQDGRWVHLLGDAVRPGGPEPEVDREVILAHGASERDEQILATYAAVAEVYGEEYQDRLDERPIERWLLDRVVDLAGGRPIADVGCGTGVATAYLARAGADVIGYDFSPAMLETARRMHPGLAFEAADLRRLLRPPAASGWGAVTAWYSLVHYTPSEVASQVAYLANLIDEEGVLALALNAGAAVSTSSTWLGREVDTPWVRHDPRQVRDAIVAAGLVEIETYIEHGDDVDHLFVLGQRPASNPST